MKKLITIVTMVTTLLIAPGARAIVSINLNTSLEGSTPTSAAPWLTAVFNNVVGGVELTLTSHLNVSSEFIQEVLFNVNPTITPSALNITTDANAPISTSRTATSNNAQSGTGGGALTQGFDVKIVWNTANNPNRFNGADIDTFKFVLTGLSESDFNFANANGIKMAAKIQGIPGQTDTLSGFVRDGGPVIDPHSSVPEPTTLIAGALLLLPFGAGVLRRVGSTPTA